MAQTLEHTAPQTLSSHFLSLSPAMRHAIRYGIATAGALWLAYAANFPQPTWPLITVMMVAQPTAGGSLQKGMLRICGTVVSGLAGIAIYGLFAQNHLLLAASISLVYAVAVYGMTGPRHGYAWNVFGFTTGIILGDAMPGTSQVEILAFDRASLVLLGLLASFAAEAIFWPVRAEDQLRGSLATRAQQVTDALRRARATLLDSNPPEHANSSQSPSALIAQLGLLDQLRAELGVTQGHVHSFARVALSLDALAAAVRMLSTDIQVRHETLSRPLHDSISGLFDRSIRALHEASQALTGGHAPERYSDALQREMTRFDEARVADLTELIETGPAQTSTPNREAGHTAAFISSLAPVLRGFVSLLDEIEAALTAVAREDDDGAPVSKPARDATSFSFTLDPLRLEMALRAGIAVASVFVVMPLLGWPVSSMPMTLAFIVAALPTRGALTSTVVGVGLAAVVAWIISDLSILYIAPHLGRMPLALLYPLLLAGAAGFVIVRFPKVGPIAPIIALIPIMTVFGGVRAPSNVEGPYDTTVILFSGIAIGAVAQRLLWPRTAAELFLRRIAGQLELCLRILRWTRKESDANGGRRMAAQSMTGYAQQLALLGQLHGQAHIEPVEQALDDQRRARLLTAVGEVFEASLRTGSLEAGESDDGPIAGHAALAPLRSAIARQDEAVTRSLDAAIQMLRQESAWKETGLTEAQAEVEARIAELRGERGLAEALGGRGADALIAHLDGRRGLATRAVAIEDWLRNWLKEKRAS